MMAMMKMKTMSQKMARMMKMLSLTEMRCQRTSWKTSWTWCKPRSRRWSCECRKALDCREPSFRQRRSEHGEPTSSILPCSSAGQSLLIVLV